PDVAMRVRVTGGGGALLPATKYWRGIAFDYYDGRSWSATIPGVRFLFKDSSSNFYALQHTGNPEMLLHQEFYMQPIDTRVVFGLDRVVKIQGPFGQISRDANGTFTGMTRPSTYQVWSRSLQVSLDQLKAAPDEIPEPIRRYYLQLPFRSERMETLARQVTATQRTTIERALAMRNYLQRTYAYSTSQPPLKSNDPVSEFLFVRKSGHCEYFASSLVLLLRHIGIPARLVNGFREGEFNTIGGFYVVRNSDAHSWTEAFIGGQWITLDPSPMMEISPEFSFGAFLNPRKILDSISFFWDRYILIYSGQDQLDTLSDIRDQYHDLRGKFRQRMPSGENISQRLLLFLNDRWKTLLLIVTLAAVSLVAMKLWARKRRDALLSRTPVLFYQEMLSILAKKGYSRPLHSTPAEFLQDIEMEMPQDGRSDLQTLTDLFYRARFGGYVLTIFDQAAIRESLRRIEQW
ncbi:MAG TPA: transglutaminaseTgpA domain-containing protein, partial [Acidobacteriota bacterium]|nr:transglutaminaseTgpA domain-containing protein [Acidobacteriota bacterium]